MLGGTASPGQSSLMLRFSQGTFDPHSTHTAGVVWVNTSVRLRDGTPLSVELWDPGKDRLRVGTTWGA
jgi:hypothetical protein